MPKYTEKNVLKIKQDIQRYSVVLSDIAKQCEEKKGELIKAAAQADAESERAVRLGNQMAISLQTHKAVMADLKDEIESLKSDKSIIESQLSLWTRLLAETISKLQSVNKTKKDNFIDSLIREGANLLLNITKKKEAEKIYLESLQKEKEVLEMNNSLLKKQELAVKEKVESLNGQIEKKNLTLNDLEKQKREIERRDYDSRVMEIRLSKEYQEVYFGRKR